MLDQAQVEWTVKAKEKGESNQDIARAQGISVRRVQQLYGEYRRSGNVPTIGKAGRPREETSDDERRAILYAGGSRNTYYYTERKRTASLNPIVVEKTRQIALRRPSYGTRRMAAQLARELAQGQ